MLSLGEEKVKINWRIIIWWSKRRLNVLKLNVESRLSVRTSTPKSRFYKQLHITGLRHSKHGARKGAENITNEETWEELERRNADSKEGRNIIDIRKQGEQKI